MIDSMTELNKSYSTTRRMQKRDANLVIAEINTAQKPEDKFETVLFLPVGEGRQGEGGLRTQGYFKKNEEDKPLITVVTVVYNGEEFIEETILSVINQTYDNVEYIIIDGGSTDATLDIIRKYEHAIDYRMSEKDKGIYDAMNKGIDLATGDWINFMNAGDSFIDETVLMSIKNDLDLNLDLIYGNHTVKDPFSGNRKIVNVRFKNDKKNIPYCHQSLFAKSSVLKKMHFNTSYKIAADYDQYMRLKSIHAKKKHVSKVIALYLGGGVSSSANKQIICEYYSIMKRYKPLYAYLIKIYRSLKLKQINISCP